MSAFHKNLIYTIYLFLILLIISACKKSDNSTAIPNVPVNFTINLSFPEFSSLNSIGNYALISSQGYRGVIVYRRALDEFVAFDLACPYDPTVNNAKLQVDSSGVIVVDLTCSSRFSLYDGSKISGPSTRPMKPYNADYDSGNNTVFIYN